MFQNTSENDRTEYSINREIAGIEQKIQTIEQNIRKAFCTRHECKRLENEINNIKELIEINSTYSNPKTDDFLWID